MKATEPMNLPAMLPVWNCPTVKSVLASAQTVINFLRKDYGIPAETAASSLPNHVAIVVPDAHARRSASICELHFGRAY